MTQPRYPITAPRLLISGEDETPRDGWTLFTAWWRDSSLYVDGYVAEYIWAHSQHEALETLKERFPSIRGMIDVLVKRDAA